MNGDLSASNSSYPLTPASPVNGAALPKKPRRWGQSCVECRRRKKGCEGRDEHGTSLCTYCPSFGLPCVFAKQTEPNRIKELEVQVGRLQDFIRALTESSAAEAQVALRQWALNPDEVLDRPRKRKRKSEQSPTPSPPLITGLTPSPLVVTPTPSRSDAETANRMRTLLDAAGFDLARRALGRPERSIVDGSSSRPSSGVARETVGSMDAWPNDATPQFDQPVSYEACREMLDLFFCWWNPRWNIINRRSFEESMFRGDNLYCTPFLLVSIFSVVAKHSFHSHNRVDEFGARGHYLLGLELYSAKPRVTTVQGLLCLAAYTSDTTKHAQSYNFVGFAMRMLDDLSFDDPASMTDLEKSVRRACTWFCFGTDKMVSLTMSRPPRFPVSQLPPLPDVDPAVDAVPWKAVRHSTDHQLHRAQSDVSQPSLQSSSVRHWCEAQIFFDEVLHRVYAGPGEDHTNSRAYVLSMRQRLNEWLDTLPADIYLHLDVFPPVCPPPHIIYLNLTIRIIGLLFYKPFINNPDIPGVAADCARLAEDTHTLFRLYATEFPPALSTLNVLHVFAGFSACHIDLLRLRDERTSQREQFILLDRIAFTSNLLSEGAGLRSDVGHWVAKLNAQRDAVLKEHRGRYDPVRDERHEVPAPPMQSHMVHHYQYPPVTDPSTGTVGVQAPPEGIDFSVLTSGVFAETGQWPTLQQDEEVSRVLRELQDFSSINNQFVAGVQA